MHRGEGRGGLTRGPEAALVTRKRLFFFPLSFLHLRRRESGGRRPEWQDCGVGVDRAVGIRASRAAVLGVGRCAGTGAVGSNDISVCKR